MNCLKNLLARLAVSLPLWSLATAVAFVGVAGLNGSTSIAQTTQASAEKLQAIKELYTNCGAGDRIESNLQETADVIEKRLTRRLTEVFAKDPKFTPAQAEERAKEDSSKIMTRFRELLAQKTQGFARDAEKVFIDVTSDNLQEDEVKYIANFYKTETGKKSMRILPKSSATAAKDMNDALKPYFAKLREEVDTGTPAGPCNAEVSVDLANVPASKQSKVKKMLELSSYNSMMADTIKVESAEQTQILVKQIETNPTLSQDEKETRIKQLKKFMELFSTRIDFAKVLEPYMIFEFCKDFDDQDLDNMIAYYSDPHSKSVQQKWSRILKETIDKMNQVMDPKLQNILGTAIDDTIKAKPQ